MVFRVSRLARLGLVSAAGSAAVAGPLAGYVDPDSEGWAVSREAFVAVVGREAAALPIEAAAAKWEQDQGPAKSAAAAVDEQEQEQEEEEEEEQDNFAPAFEALPRYSRWRDAAGPVMHGGLVRSDGSADGGSTDGRTSLSSLARSTSTVPGSAGELQTMLSIRPPPPEQGSKTLNTAPRVAGMIPAHRQGKRTVDVSRRRGSFSPAVPDQVCKIFVAFHGSAADRFRLMTSTTAETIRAYFEQPEVGCTGRGGDCSLADSGGDSAAGGR